MKNVNSLFFSKIKYFINLFLAALMFLCFSLTVQIDGAIIDGTTNVKHLNAPQDFSGADSLVKGCASLKGGCNIGARTAMFDTSGVLNGPVHANAVGGGIWLRHDLTLGCTAVLITDDTFTFSGGGHTLKLTNSFHVFSGKTLQIASDLNINGRGNHIFLDGTILVDPSTTLTIRNATIIASGGSFTVNSQRSRLALQNVDLRIENGGSIIFDDTGFGESFIHDDVIVSGYGTNFTYQASTPLFIAPDSMLYFDVGTTFLYSNSNNNRDLVRMADATSVLYLNGCTLDASTGSDGMLLTKGTIVFDNNVIINNYGNTDVAKSVELGDSTNPVTVNVLAGARVDVNGYLYHNP
jgi:hypothetical protein